MQQRQQRTKKGQVKARASVCFTCSHACDGRRCGWADTLKTENLPEGAEFIISHRKTYRGKDKIYYQIKSCPKHEKGYTNTPPQETNALKLAETMLYKLSESYEKALCENDQKLIYDYEVLIRENWIWEVLFQAGYTNSSPEDCIKAIKKKAHDAQSVTVLTDWLIFRLDNVKPDLLKNYKTAIEHYRDTDMIDVISTKRLIKELKTRIENTEPKNFENVKNQICDNVIPELIKLIEENRQKPIEKPKKKKSFVAHREKPEAEKTPDPIEMWWANMTMYLNLMC